MVLQAGHCLDFSGQKLCVDLITDLGRQLGEHCHSRVGTKVVKADGFVRRKFV
jgi:hypothetical protein